MHNIDIVIIGAGVIGLAVARALVRDGHETLVLEAAESFGTGISARNSEVIHAGIYYQPGSLKARMCTAGRKQIYEFCSDHGIPHRRCGKIIVATSLPQLSSLEAIAANASSNGVFLVDLDRVALSAIEPAISGVGALCSPETGDFRRPRLYARSSRRGRGLRGKYLLRYKGRPYVGRARRRRAGRQWR